MGMYHSEKSNDNKVLLCSFISSTNVPIGYRDETQNVNVSLNGYKYLKVLLGPILDENGSLGEIYRSCIFELDKIVGLYAVNYTGIAGTFETYSITFTVYVRVNTNNKNIVALQMRTDYKDTENKKGYNYKYKIEVYGIK